MPPRTCTWRTGPACRWSPRYGRRASLPLAGGAGLVLHVSNTQLARNRGSNGGGGIAAAQGTATLTGSELTANTAERAVGGGVVNVGTVAGSTISGNTADAGGGVEDFPGLARPVISAPSNCTIAAEPAG